MTSYEPLSQVEVVQMVARGMARDLLEMIQECDGLDSVVVLANARNDLPAVSWTGYRDGLKVFGVQLVGEELVPHE